MRLQRVARIVEGAMQSGEPPGPLVARKLGVSPGVARTLIHRARAAGKLRDPAHVPAVAVKHRGTAREFRWRVCDTCLTPWPCGSWRSG